MKTLLTAYRRHTCSSCLQSLPSQIDSPAQTLFSNPSPVPHVRSSFFLPEGLGQPKLSLNIRKLQAVTFLPPFYKPKTKPKTDISSLPLTLHKNRYLSLFRTIPLQHQPISAFYFPETISLHTHCAISHASSTFIALQPFYNKSKCRTTPAPIPVARVMLPRLCFLLGEYIALHYRT